ncbi:unnamed protein product [Caenorhabditis angaria]|uniref:Ribosome-recycling factor, mitochondrial n=1 Tax=Caenorhabditis angaria TaxID=860376 RepID=A0A9P1MUE2_9PELO|nr:unnamed protein product [Caenorhabditis angaria]
MNRVGFLVSTISTCRQFSRLQFSTTPQIFKKKINEKQKKGNQQVHFANLEENQIVKDTHKELQEVEKILHEELARHFSLKVDVRQYEEIMVKLDTGKDKQLSHLARVTMKSPLMVMINFQDNPAAMKAAKLAIQKSTLNVTPQQEGAVLYITIPPMSRERREKMAQDAKTRILNEYKKALNEIYTKGDKKSSAEFAGKPDDARKTRQMLLDLKKSAENKAGQLIEAKRQELLKQVV